MVYRCEQVDSLQYATLATVSRCGMVWFSASEEGGIDSDTAPNPGTVTNEMLLRHKVGRYYQAIGNTACLPILLPYCHRRQVAFFFPVLAVSACMSRFALRYLYCFVYYLLTEISSRVVFCRRDTVLSSKGYRGPDLLCLDLCARLHRFVGSSTPLHSLLGAITDGLTCAHRDDFTSPRYVQIMRLRSDPVSLLEGSPSAVGVPGGEAAGGGGQGLAPSTAQVRGMQMP